MNLDENFFLFYARPWMIWSDLFEGQPERRGYD